MSMCTLCAPELPLRHRCVECIRQYHKNWRANNREKVNTTSREWQRNHADQINASRRSTEGRLKINKRYRERYAEDPCFKLRKLVSRAVNIVMGSKKNSKSVFNYLSYSKEEMKIHLESQFSHDMTWENYGKFWHIDHIYPQSLLLYVSMEEENFKKCWALSNLRPLEATLNIQKSNKVSHELP